MEALPPFSDLTQGDLDALLERAMVRSYAKNTVIVTEGDTGESIYFVLKGKVKVFLSNDHGREIVISQIGAGDYFGEMSLEPGSRSASVMTMEQSRFAVVKIADFRDFLKAHPEFMLALIGKLIRRSRTLARNVKNLALLDVYGRLAQLLHDLAVPEGSIWVIETPMTQRDIANHIGSSREMISRIFKDLIAGGYLDVTRQRIEIRRRLPTAW